MNYKSEFKNIYNNTEYKITNKMYYRVKAFKVSVKYWSSVIVDNVFDKQKNDYSLYSYKPYPMFKHLFKTQEEIAMFVRTLSWGNYFKTEIEVIDFLNKLAFIKQKLGDTINQPIVICGPKDEDHLNELKGLKINKKTEINGIKLKEILKKPTHLGYKYKLQGIYHFEKSPNNINQIKEEIMTFVEVFGGKENYNIMFTGTIKNILDGDLFLENLYAIRSILRGYKTSLTFTLHYKDHGELLSINFMKNNVSIVSAVEFMQ